MHRHGSQTIIFSLSPYCCIVFQSTAPFDLASFRNGLGGGTGVYDCGMNFMCLDFDYSPDPGVPINMPAVERQCEKQYPEPCPYKGKLTVAVDSATEDPLRKGELQCLSPEESRYAFMLAIRRDLADKKKSANWLAALLSVCMSFMVIANTEDRFKEALNLRELPGDEYALVGRTVFQRIVQIWNFKVRLERALQIVLAAAAVAEHFLKDARLCTELSSEAVNATFIDMALTVYKRALVHKPVVAVIQRLEWKFHKQSPFNIMGNLHGIVTKGKTEKGIVWIYQGIADLCLSGERVPSEFHVRFVTGQGCGGKGMADLIRFKLNMKSYFLGEFLEQLRLRYDVKRRIREVLGDYESYRTMLAPHPDEPAADLAWLGDWSAAEKEALVFGEASI